MLLIEADGKALLAAAGIPVPLGVVVTAELPALPGAGPWMVKAQVPVGGRGKAGGVVRCQTAADVAATTSQMLGSRLKGHTVEACLVEQAAEGEERYLAVMVDPGSYGLRVIYAAQGGMDIESAAGAVHERLCPLHSGAVAEVLADLIADEPQSWRAHLAGIGKTLADMVIEGELALAEINPLFVSETGCLAGDAKVVVDLNAVDRQPAIAALIAGRPTTYLDAGRKLAEGFDYVELDPEGEIGLVTTGAGLSMMLIDELTARGARPLNFCDIRTGQMRGSPARLMRVLEWITAASSLKAVLVNIFAGITDLGEFAGLLAAALEQSPRLTVPVVARLVGRGAMEAQHILTERRPGMLVTEDLEEALTAIDLIVRTAA
ncbi:ATP-grasp domain-containing protein [Rhodopila sp.]|uniref:ATP-grasp domain-containing protein n=1 Tax=Rhodopila sp. TaxID=2480087 RepID=UPI003D0D36C6